MPDTYFCYGGACNGLIHPSDPPRYEQDRLIWVCDVCSRQWLMREPVKEQETEKT